MDITTDSYLTCQVCCEFYQLPHPPVSRVTDIVVHSWGRRFLLACGHVRS